MTTTQITSSAATFFFGATSAATIADSIADALGEFVDDYDVDAIEVEYREALQATLPEGATLAGEFVFAEVGTEFDLDAIREAVEDIDFWAIAERHDTTA